MPDKVAQYIAASDNASDYSDHLMDQIQQDAAEDIDDMFTSSANRDADLWDSWDVSPELVVADYDEIPRLERDLNWTLGMAGISAAATTQFFLDNAEQTIIKPTAYREQVLAGFVLTRSELIAAGKRSTKLNHTLSFVQLKDEFRAGMGFLSGIPSSELYTTLLESEAILPLEKRIADAVGYISRMTNYPPNSIQFKEEVSSLIDVNSGRNLKRMNRRAVERVHSYRDANGDGQTLMVWLVEGGPGTCSWCLENAGVVDTYEGWIQNGLPGAETCKGGDSCQCHLATA